MFRIYLPVFIVAVIARCVMFCSYLHSALPGYSYVYGLDMETLIRLGIFFNEGKLSFNFYAAFVGILVNVFGKSVGIHWVIVFQMLAGCVMAVTVAYIIRRLLFRRILALTGGLLAALYAPELIYESVTLKESIGLLLATFALAAPIWMKVRRFSPFSLLVGGMVIAWPGWIRFTGLFWLLAVSVWLAFIFYRRYGFRELVKKMVILWCGFALWVGLVASINVSRGVAWWPFMFDGYNLRLGWAISSKPKMDSLNVGTDARISPEHYRNNTMIMPKNVISAQDRILRVADYLQQVFKSNELCDNINYYYWRNRIEWLWWLPGPQLLLPLAVTGFLLMLASGCVMRRESIILLYVAVFALPLAFWIPVGRYRLILLPCLCFSVVWLVHWIFAHCFCWRYRILRMVIMLLVLSVVYFWSSGTAVILRASDFIAEGKAWEALRGKGNDAAYAAYEKAWLLDPNSSATVVNYGEALLTSGKVSRAEQILAGGIAAYPGNFSLRIFYVGSLLAGGKAVLAEKIMKETAIPPENRERFIYYYHLGECYRLNGKASDAITAYRQALPLAVNDVQRRQIQSLIDVLSAGRH